MRNFKIKAHLIVKYFQYFPLIQIYIKVKLTVSTVISVLIVPQYSTSESHSDNSRTFWWRISKLKPSYMSDIVNLNISLKETPCFQRLISLQTDSGPLQRVTYVISGSSDVEFQS